MMVVVVVAVAEVSVAVVVAVAARDLWQLRLLWHLDWGGCGGCSGSTCCGGSICCCFCPDLQSYTYADYPTTWFYTHCSSSRVSAKLTIFTVTDIRLTSMKTAPLIHCLNLSSDDSSICSDIQTENYYYTHCVENNSGNILHNCCCVNYCLTVQCVGSLL